MKQIENACWGCRYSYPCREDSYRCPWASRFHGIKQWERDENGFIIKCPRFVEDGWWSPSEWKKFKIRYVEQKRQRIVCLEAKKMFISKHEAAKWLFETGRKKDMRLPTSFQRATTLDLKCFQSFGYHWEYVENDERRGFKYYEGDKNESNQ